MAKDLIDKVEILLSLDPSKYKHEMKTLIENTQKELNKLYPVYQDALKRNDQALQASLSKQMTIIEGHYVAHKTQARKTTDMIVSEENRRDKLFERISNHRYLKELQAEEKKNKRILDAKKSFWDLLAATQWAKEKENDALSAQFEKNRIQRMYASMFDTIAAKEAQNAKLEKFRKDNSDRVAAHLNSMEELRLKRLKLLLDKELEAEKAIEDKKLKLAKEYEERSAEFDRARIERKRKDTEASYRSMFDTISKAEEAKKTLYAQYDKQQAEAEKIRLEQITKLQRDYSERSAEFDRVKAERKKKDTEAMYASLFKTISDNEDKIKRIQEGKNIASAKRLEAHLDKMEALKKKKQELALRREKEALEKEKELEKKAQQAKEAARKRADEKYNAAVKRILEQRRVLFKSMGEKELRDHIKLLESKKNKTKAHHNEILLAEKELNKKLEEERKRQTAAANKPSFGSRVWSSAKNVAYYATGGLMMSPYLMALQAVGSGIRSMINDSVELNKTLYQLRATTNAGAGDMRSMSAMIKEVSIATGFASSEVAKFALTLSKMGVASKDIADVGKSISYLAKVTGGDLNKTGEVVIQTMNGFSKSFKDADYYTNIMMRTINGSALDLDKYATIMGYVSAAAEEASVSFEQANAMVGLLANSGLKASTVGTSLRNIFGKLAGDGENLTDVIKRLKDENISYGDAVELVGQRAANALMVLIDSYDKIEEAQNRVDAGIVTTGDKMLLIQESLFTKTKKMLNSFSAMASFLFQSDIAAGEAAGNEDAMLKKMYADAAGGGFASMPKTYSQFDEDTKAAMEALVRMKIERKYDKDWLSKFSDLGAYDAFEEIVQNAVGELKGDHLLAMSLGLGKDSSDSDYKKAAERLVGHKRKELFETRKSKAETEARDALKKFMEQGGIKGFDYGVDEKGSAKFKDDVALKAAELLKEKAKGQGIALNPEDIKTMSYALIPKAGVEQLNDLEEWRKGYDYYVDEKDAIYNKVTDKTEEDYKNLQKFEEKQKALLEKICAVTQGADPRCANMKGGGGHKPDAIRNLADIKMQLGGLSSIGIMKSTKANVYSAQEEMFNQIAGISAESGTPEYEAELDRIKKEYIKAAELELKSFADIAKIKESDLETIGDLQDALEERSKERERDIKIKYRGKLDTDEYLNAYDNMKKEEEELANRLRDAFNLLSGQFAKEAGIIRDLAAKPLKDSISFEKTDVTSNELLDILEGIVVGEGDLATSRAYSEIEKEKKELEYRRTIGVGESMKINKEIVEIQKEAWESRISKAKDLAEKYKAAQKGFEEQATKKQASIKANKAKRDEALAAVGLMSDGDLGLSVYGGATTKQKAIENINAKSYSAINAETKEYNALNKKAAEAGIKASQYQLKSQELEPDKMELRDKAKVVWGEMEQHLGTAVDLYQSYQDKLLQATLDRINREIEAEENKAQREDSINRGALELGLTSQGEYADKKQEIEDNLAKRKEELQKKAFDAEKKAELKMAAIRGTIATSQIAINLLINASSKGPLGLLSFPAALAAYTALSVAQTGAEIAAISKKEYVPKQFAKGGMLKGASHKEGGIPFTIAGRGGFEAEGGEYMINKYSTAKYINEIEAINRDEFDKNSYINGNSETNALLRAILAENVKPVRAFVTSSDLRSDERARKVIDNRTKVNG